MSSRWKHGRGRRPMTPDDLVEDDSSVKFERLTWADRIDYSNLWKLLIQKAALARADSNLSQYINTIEALKQVLFKDMREKVREFENLHLKGISRRDWSYSELILKCIIDLLEEKGFLGKGFTKEVHK